MLLLVLLVSALVEAAGKAPVLPVGSTSQVEDAELFRLYYGQSFKVIKNSVDGNSYLLMQALDTTFFPVTTEGLLEITLEDGMVDSEDYLDISPSVGSFELLGLLDCLRGMTSEFVTSECVLKSYATGNIQLVNQTNMQQIAQFTAHFSSNVNKVQACNLAAFVPLEERTPMQRAEWIKYLATFTNLEARANIIYDAIKENYNCLTKVAANLTTRFKPIVAWVEYKQGLWGFSREDYKLQFVTDAGGENVDGTISSNSYNVSSPDDMRTFYAILCTVDVVIDQTYASEPAEYMLSTFLENLNVDDNATF
ncbi:hypothetical protein HPP92_014173 [Vanilla planifolia]|uniref:Uncharacterized protein n=1 Tax=Vanilla planifolia TaxID=51239 RepID=A0A835UUI1_VANPL|nr:hypothetical protein HPP92_014173 [Vanilla planifolia]